MNIEISGHIFLGGELGRVTFVVFQINCFVIKTKADNIHNNLYAFLRLSQWRGSFQFRESW